MATISPSKRVAASRARAITAGAQRLPSGLLPPDAAVAMDELVEAGYARGKAACIARALIEARGRQKPPKQAR